MHPRRWLPALGAAVLAAAPLASQTLTAGLEVQVSIGSFEHPRETVPALAVGPDGGFLSAWLDHGLRVRGVSPADVPLAPARKLSGITHPGPAVVALGPGRYMAVWAESTVLPQILGQILDAAGAPVGSPLVLANAAVSPVVAPAPAGGFVVSWTDSPDFPPPPPHLPLHLVRRFDAQAQPVGGEIPFGGPLDQVSSLAVLPGGGFAVVSARHLIPADAGSIEVYLRVFARDGTPAGPQITLSSDAENPWLRARVAADSAGRFVVAWTEYPPPDNTTTMQVWAQRFSPAGQPLGPPILAAEKSGFYPILGDVAVRPDGSFLIEWGETPAVSSDGGQETGDVLARAFDAAGTPLGPAFLVHTSQEGGNRASEGEAEATAEGWIVSWTRFAAGQGVYARRFTLSCGTGNELCLHGGRFRATAHWKTSPRGPEGPGRPLGLTGDTGAFWFFAPTNAELVVKVLDGTGVNGHFWVFYGSLTNVEFDLTVTDTATGQQRTYHNPAGTMASRADTEAF